MVRTSRVHDRVQRLAVEYVTPPRWNATIPLRWRIHGHARWPLRLSLDESTPRDRRARLMQIGPNKPLRPRLAQPCRTNELDRSGGRPPGRSQLRKKEWSMAQSRESTSSEQSRSGASGVEHVRKLWRTRARRIRGTSSERLRCERWRRYERSGNRDHWPGPGPGHEVRRYGSPASDLTDRHATAASGRHPQYGGDSAP